MSSCADQIEVNVSVFTVDDLDDLPWLYGAWYDHPQAGVGMSCQSFCWGSDLIWSDSACSSLLTQSFFLHLDGSSVGVELDLPTCQLSRLEVGQIKAGHPWAYVRRLLQCLLGLPLLIVGYIVTYLAQAPAIGF